MGSVCDCGKPGDSGVVLDPCRKSEDIKELSLRCPPEHPLGTVDQDAHHSAPPIPNTDPAPETSKQYVISAEEQKRFLSRVASLQYENSNAKVRTPDPE